MNLDDKNLDKKIKSRANALDEMNRKIEDKKIKELERSIDYLNFFLSRKIDVEKTEK